MEFKLLKYEAGLWDKGVGNIAGVDEVGRGALAGPFVVAAVVLNKDHFRNNDVSLEILDLYAKIKDSKLLTPRKREELEAFIKKSAICYSISLVEPEKLDEIGLTAATKNLFSDAVNMLEIRPEHVLTDSFAVDGWDKELQTNIVGGDNLSITVAAASIVAKVYRDRLMVEAGSVYPFYGFEKHKGYGTKAHLEALKKYGPCEIHRSSFAPVIKSVL